MSIPNSKATLLVTPKISNSDDEESSSNPPLVSATDENQSALNQPELEPEPEPETPPSSSLQPAPQVPEPTMSDGPIYLASKLVGPAHPLQSTWVIWDHDLKSSDWSLASYRQLYEFSTIEGFWAFENVRPPVANAMFFMMKKGHPPIWEVPSNRQGGSWCFKFPKKVADKQWLEFSLFLIGETMANDTSQLVGLSISPKIYNVTVRIWNKNSDLVRDTVEFREEILRHKPLYKEFRDHRD